LELRPGGIEDRLSRSGHLLNLKIVAHNQQDVEISGGGFGGDKTTPNESTAQPPAAAGEFHNPAQSA